MAIENFLEEKFNNRRNLEGNSGISILEQTIMRAGYDDRYSNSLVEAFLQDNPGAIECLIDFIGEHFEDKFSDWGDEEE